MANVYFHGPAPTVAAAAVNHKHVGPIKISQVLQRFLKKTLRRKVSWKRTQKRSQGIMVEDQFTAEDGGIEISMTATRREEDGGGIPETLNQWEVTLKAPGKKDRTLDGQSMPLPKTVSEDSDLTKQTLSKLFRAAYEAVLEVFDSITPHIFRMVDLLRDGVIQSCYSFVRPSVYNPMGAAEILQVGGSVDGIDMCLEIMSFGGNHRLVLRMGETRKKLDPQAMENPELNAAVTELVQLAHDQRTGRITSGEPLV